MVKISGNTFFVTGGASGLGAGVVDVFVASGANVVILDMNEAAGQVMMAKTPLQVYFPGKTDVTSADDVHTAIKKSEEKFPTFGGAILCAGVMTTGVTAALPGEEAPYGLESIDAFRRMLDVNVIGSFNVAQQVAQLLIRRPFASGAEERGGIVLTTSYVSTDGQGGSVGYSTTKGAIASMVLPMARDLARYSIRVNAVAPGVFLTPINDKFITENSKCGEFPVRPGRPVEFGRLVEHIFENAMINGATIRQDGALRGAISID